MARISRTQKSVYRATALAWDLRAKIAALRLLLASIPRDDVPELPKILDQLNLAEAAIEQVHRLVLE